MLRQKHVHTGKQHPRGLRQLFRLYEIGFVALLVLLIVETVVAILIYQRTAALCVTLTLSPPSTRSTRAPPCPSAISPAP
jgi:hypothetical protein